MLDLALLEAQIAELARGLIGKDFPDIRNSYIDNLAGAMNEYLEGTGSITKPRNEARRAIEEHFDAAFFTGYVDAGGNISQMEDADRDWFLARINQEIGYLDMLFQDLKTIRKEAEETGTAAGDIVLRRATGYARTLDGIYAEGKLRAGREQSGTWRLGGTIEHCDTCVGLDGKRHKLSWFLDRGYVPQQPGNRNLDCGGWQCGCVIEDDDGNQLIP